MAPALGSLSCYSCYTPGCHDLPRTLALASARVLQTPPHYLFWHDKNGKIAHTRNIEQKKYFFYNHSWALLVSLKFLSFIADTFTFPVSQYQYQNDILFFVHIILGLLLLFLIFVLTLFCTLIDAGTMRSMDIFMS